MYFSRLSSPAPPAGKLSHGVPQRRDRPRQGRVVELELAGVGGQRDELDVVADRLAGARREEAVPAGQLDRQEVAHGEVDRRAGPGLADRAHDRVVVDDVAVDHAVVEVHVVRPVEVRAVDRGDGRGVVWGVGSAHGRVGVPGPSFAKTVVGMSHVVSFGGAAGSPAGTSDQPLGAPCVATW